MEGADATRYVSSMADDSKPLKPPKPAPDSREARLAQALRANLRRRKTPPPKPAAEPD